MLGTKREALARAMQKVRLDNDGWIREPGQYTVSMDKFHGQWLPYVDALLQELREPDEGMLDRALGHMVVTEPGDEYLIQKHRADDKATWQAMIDHLMEK